MGQTFKRMVWMGLPLLVVAWMAAPEWPARAGMMDAPWRDVWVPTANAWAQVHPVEAPPTADEAPPSPAVAQTPASAASTTQALAVSIESAPASARSSAAPSGTPSTASVATPAIAGQPGTVLMVGDSLMGEVAAGLRQHLPRSYTVVDRHKSSTGLTNVAYYDWPATAESATRSTHPQWVIVHMGANDAQDMLVDGHWLRFGSEAWRAQYQARAEAMIRRIRAADPQVTLVWIGLPAMRSEAFEAKMVTIRAMQSAAAAAQQVVYLDGHTALGQAYAKDAEIHPGRRQILRADDGIHYSRTGGTLLAREAALTQTLAFPWASN